MKTIDTNVLVLGAGISGQIFSRIYRNKIDSDSITVIEAEEKSNPLNRLPVFFLHEDISSHVLFDFKKSKMNFAIYSGGWISSHWDLKMMNEYSRKIGNGTITENSIKYIDGNQKDIWLFDERFFNSPIIYGEAVRNINLASRFVMTDDLRIEYNFLVSTLPIRIFLDLCGMRTTLSFDSISIAYRSYETSHVISNQCVYVSDGNVPFYRMSILNGITTFEYSGVPYFTDDAFMKKENDFARFIGIGDLSLDEMYQGNVPVGRIIPNDKSEMKTFFRFFTDRYNVFFLGRNATWTYVRTENLHKDVEKIIAWIHVKEEMGRFIDEGIIS